LWLQEHASGPRRKIMGTGTAIPYYSRGDLWYLPYADSSLALRYIKKRNPDYVVLQGNSRPYLREWIRDGIPDQNAALIYKTGRSIEDALVIYKWRNDSSFSVGEANELSGDRNSSVKARSLR
jgi:hypothetical protein